MNRYNQLEEVATMGFAPDSSFPLTYAEKGLLQAKLHGPGHPCLSIEAGTAYNVVPAKASYSGHLLAGVIAELDQLGFDYEIKDDQVTVLGISRHAKDAAEGSMPSFVWQRLWNISKIIQPWTLSSMQLVKMPQDLSFW